MPALGVVDAGTSSVQGLGRYGSQRYGISPGGAMDRLALAEVNALADQPAGAAAIEIGPLPARFIVQGSPARIALSGAERQVLVDGQPLALGRTALVTDGATITIKGARIGQYSYLTCQGGLTGCTRDASHERLDTTNGNALRIWILRAGDTIGLENAKSNQPEKSLRLHPRSRAPVRVVLGPQLDHFATEDVWRFLATSWSVSHASNRMAYVLDGGRVALSKGHNIVSDGTVTGNIQIAGSGQPVVILCDRGTIGGYPKIATIISADLGRFAQMTLGMPFQFEAISVMEAQTVARDFAFRLANLKPKVEIVPAGGVSVEALLAGNVAGDVYNAMDWHSGSHEDWARDEERRM